MRRNPRDYDWVIMGASAWIAGKPTIEKIVKENGHTSTIMVVQRLDDVYNATPKNIFVLGSCGDNGQVGERKSFVKDTGLGYGNGGYCTIQNIIKIDKNGITDPGNGIGVNEKRPLWVFK